MNVETITADVRGLCHALDARRLTEIVDVGANPIDGDPPYKPLLDAAVARITGFEPQADALAQLNAARSSRERYLPYALGDGGSHRLRLYENRGLVSLFELDPRAMRLFTHFEPGIALREEVLLQTKRLDEVEEIGTLDFLKIDIQGSELEVFRHGRQKLAQALVIQTEVSFFPLYRHQPCIGDVDLELRSQGFIPHCLAAPPKTAPIAPVLYEGDPWRGQNQLLEADMVYVRDFRRPEDFSDEMLKHLALIASGCYRSIDLAYWCLSQLVQRRAIADEVPSRYMQGTLAAPSAGPAADPSLLGR